MLFALAPNLPNSNTVKGGKGIMAAHGGLRAAVQKAYPEIRFPLWRGAHPAASIINICKKLLTSHKYPIFSLIRSQMRIRKPDRNGVVPFSIPLPPM